MAVAELDLGVPHLAKVEFHRSLVLDNPLLLIVEHLFGNCVGNKRLLIACEIDFCLSEHCFIVLKQTFCLLQLRLVRTWIEVNERVAFVYDLSFVVVHG